MKYSLQTLALLCMSFSMMAQNDIDIGKGYILLSGANSDETAWNTFIEKAGGQDANYLIIPTAVSDRDIDPTIRGMKRKLESRGVAKIKHLHTRDNIVVNADSTLQKIRNADAIWFSGGISLRLAKAYVDTKVVEELRKFLSRGGIIMGESAGAMIMGSFLLRGKADNNRDVFQGFKKGFGLIPNCVIDAHTLEYNHQFDISRVRKKEKQLLGIGIDKGASILIHNDHFQVISEGYVLVYDGRILNGGKTQYFQTKQSNDQFYLLTAGDEYDLQKRTYVFWENKQKSVLPGSELKKYEGVYQRDKQAIKMFLSIDGDEILVKRSWNNFSFHLIPENRQQFFRKENPIKVNFEFNESNKVIGLKFYQNGTIRHWTKIEKDD